MILSYPKFDIFLKDSSCWSIVKNKYLFHIISLNFFVLKDCRTLFTLNSNVFFWPTTSNFNVEKTKLKKKMNTKNKNLKDNKNLESHKTKLSTVNLGR